MGCVCGNEIAAECRCIQPGNEETWAGTQNPDMAMVNIAEGRTAAKVAFNGRRPDLKVISCVALPRCQPGLLKEDNVLLSRSELLSQKVLFSLHGLHIVGTDAQWAVSRGSLAACDDWGRDAPNGNRIWGLIITLH